MIGDEIDFVGHLIIREGRGWRRHVVSLNVIAESDDHATLAFRVDDGAWQRRTVATSLMESLLGQAMEMAAGVVA